MSVDLYSLLQEAPASAKVITAFCLQTRTLYCQPF